MSAGDLGRGIALGEIDPVALAEVFLSAANAHPGGPRIYARLTSDRALAEAEAAARRARAGQLLSPLDGVPVAWKDLFDIAVKHHLHFDPARQVGAVFHMMSALGECGQVGITAVGNSPAEADDLYARTVAAIDAEALAATAARSLPAV